MICIQGPTAAGKTAVATSLVQRLPCAVVSVDSAMIYRGMDIGTAKPTRSELAAAPHALIDIRDPADGYDAAQFVLDAKLEIKRIADAGRIPLLVGGTMLYFRALLSGLSSLPPAQPELRAKIEAEIALNGIAQAYAKLGAIDPASAQRIEANDPQRIARALEVHAIAGRPMSELLAERSPWRGPALRIVVAPSDRGVLHHRINQRAQVMIDQGLIAETKALIGSGRLNATMPIARAVGYRQVIEFLASDWTEAALAERIAAATRQYAKRQLTWLRKIDVAQWFAPDQQADIEGLVASFIQLYSHGQARMPID